MAKFKVNHHQNFSRIAFFAMASPCEVLLRNLDPILCHTIGDLVVDEVTRIEQKYSRYVQGNLVDQMNRSQGRKVTIDEETFKLLEYAQDLFEVSDGLFDISSGVLRRIWKFGDNSAPPSHRQIDNQLKKIGFDKIEYDQVSFYMNKGMEIDFGGIGKEYAVDQVTELVEQKCRESNSNFLVNFGGDISATKLNDDALPWTIGIEPAGCHDDLAAEERLNSFIYISQGAVATSGITHRFFDYDGKRYGHLMNPKTGYPVEGAPFSVTTFANNCVLAGSFSSLAMLMGAHAEEFLIEHSVKHLCYW